MGTSQTSCFTNFKQIKNLMTVLITLNKSTTLFRRNSVTCRSPCHGKGDFVFWLSPSPCYLEDAMQCQWSSSSYGDPASIKACLGASSSALMLAGLYADLRNKAPARLFV